MDYHEIILILKSYGGIGIISLVFIWLIREGHLKLILTIGKKGKKE